MEEQLIPKDTVIEIIDARKSKYQSTPEYLCKAPNDPCDPLDFTIKPSRMKYCEWMSTKNGCPHLGGNHLPKTGNTCKTCPYKTNVQSNKVKGKKN
jgi:hypothetical protein